MSELNGVMPDFRGFCTRCSSTLRKINLNPKEFETLKQAFFDKVIIGKDLFNKSTPEEIRMFKEFISTARKYDVVIDGLNVAYSSGVKKSMQFTSTLVASVVRHYTNQRKTVLVLGRTHMKRWPARNINYIQKAADTFYVGSLSQDDPFLLYCALNSGLNTIIVSRDLMRSHIFRLENVEHKRLFSRWLSQSQHMFERVLNDGRVIIKSPPPFIRTTQKLQSVWHIPYTNKANDNDFNWLCAKL